jgi:hypothetical protein
MVRYYFRILLQVQYNIEHLFLAEYEENIHIDDSKFGPLEAPDSPKNLSTIPQVTDFSDILAISNAIKNFQVLNYFLFTE